MFDGLPFDPFTLLDDGWRPAEVGVGGRHVAQALVVTLVIVVLDEGLDLALEVAGQEVVFQQDAVFQGLVPALDLALLGFGRGIHFCLGNQLARMAMRVALGRLLDRLDNLRLSDKHPAPQFRANFQVHALTV